MRICIHRGARVIGGNCVEVSTASTRVLLDLGMPLFDPKDKNRKFDTRGIQKKSEAALLAEGVLPAVDGLHDVSGQKSIDAILLSHPHQDHYGLIGRARPDIPVVLSEDADKLLRMSDIFLPVKLGDRDKIIIGHRKPQKIGDMTVTGFLMDHSAFGSMAYLLEAEGRRVFYSGDFRGHGRTGWRFRQLVDDPPVNLDCLVMEGTIFGRESERVRTEEEVEKDVLAAARAHRGLKLVFVSGQNIDRVVTFVKAAAKTNHVFVADLYLANILDAIKESGRLPYPGNPALPVMRVLFTKHFVRRLKVAKRPELYKKFERFEISRRELGGLGGRAFVMYRERTIRELEMAGIPPESVMLYSMWEGYMEDESFRATQEFIKRHGIRLDHDCHTSGHASLPDLKRLVRALNPRILVPIHTKYPRRFSELWDSVKCLNDGDALDL